MCQVWMKGFRWPSDLIYRIATTMCHVTYRHIKCFITWLVCFIFIFWVSIVNIEYNDFSYKCFTFLRFNPHIETNMWQVCYELAKASVSPPGLSSSLSRNTLSVLWQSYDCIMPLIRKIKITLKTYCILYWNHKMYCVDLLWQPCVLRVYCSKR